jgi:hypothetical protein
MALTIVDRSTATLFDNINVKKENMTSEYWKNELKEYLLSQISNSYTNPISFNDYSLSFYSSKKHPVGFNLGVLNIGELYTMLKDIIIEMNKESDKYIYTVTKGYSIIEIKITDKTEPKEETKKKRNRFVHMFSKWFAKQSVQEPLKKEPVKEPAKNSLKNPSLEHPTADAVKKYTVKSDAIKSVD